MARHGIAVVEQGWMVASRFIEWTRTGLGMCAMVLINLLSVAALGAYLWEQRNDRIEAATALAEWTSATLYAPTELTVYIGPTMNSTRIVESPLFDGPRILEDFPGRWVTRLRHTSTDTLVCTMPQTGPRFGSYTARAPMRFDATWPEYTGDNGACFRRMQPGEQYDLTTVREAFTVIDGERHQRFLEPVQSKPFTFPGVP